MKNRLILRTPKHKQGITRINKTGYLFNRLLTDRLSGIPRTHIGRCLPRNWYWRREYFPGKYINLN